MDSRRDSRQGGHPVPAAPDRGAHRRRQPHRQHRAGEQQRPTRRRGRRGIRRSHPLTRRSVSATPRRVWPVAERNGVTFGEWCSASGGYPQGCVHPDIGRDAHGLAGERASFRWLGGLPRQGVACRPEPSLRLAVHGLVRSDRPALRGWRLDVVAGGKRLPLRRRARYPSVVRRDAASVGFREGLASEPSLVDPDTVYAGVEDAGLFRSTDGAASWQEIPALRGHSTAASWQPGAGGMCLHTILLDPVDPDRMFVAISAAGRFAPTTPDRPGSRSTVGCDQEGTRTRTPRSAIAFIGSPCTRSGRMCCSCRSTGM